MSIQLFSTPVNSPELAYLTALYFVSTAISTFDVRITQAKQNGFLRHSEAVVPGWTAIFSFLASGSIAAIILMNWQYALCVLIIKFILKVLPILENIGAFLLIPVVGKEVSSKVNLVAQQQRDALEAVRRMEETRDSNGSK